jgi:hypothetical protein
MQVRLAKAVMARADADHGANGSSSRSSNGSAIHIDGENAMNVVKGGEYYAEEPPTPLLDTINYPAQMKNLNIKVRSIVHSSSIHHGGDITRFVVISGINSCIASGTTTI